mgnify:CR=1 FL=1
MKTHNNHCRYQQQSISIFFFFKTKKVKLKNYHYDQPFFNDKRNSVKKKEKISKISNHVMSK